jgi:hypothetical protein
MNESKHWNDFFSSIILRIILPILKKTGNAHAQKQHFQDFLPIVSPNGQMVHFRKDRLFYPLQRVQIKMLSKNSSLISFCRTKHSLSMQNQ